MKIESNTLYSILEKYIQEYGHLIDSPDQLRYALVDINEIKSFAHYKACTVINSAQAKRISETGLQWLSYAQLHPTTPEKFTEKAQEKLKGHYPVKSTLDLVTPTDKTIFSSESEK